jgi:hypothetical protein
MLLFDFLPMANAPNQVSLPRAAVYMHTRSIQQSFRAGRHHLNAKHYRLFRDGALIRRLEHGFLLFLDGVYVNGAKGATARFHRVDEPTSGELTELAHTLAHRFGRYLERLGWLTRKAENR